MGKIYTALGLMSGTSMDGVDISIIKSDGESEFLTIFDKFYEYDEDIRKNLVELRDKINSFKDLNIYEHEVKNIEKDITIFQASVTKKTIDLAKTNIDLIGFHGQTIFHNSDIKVSKQLGDGKLLSQLLKTRVVYDFRKNDLINGGQGAPLTPIFHNMLANKIYKRYKIDFPINILNIGGISNVTKIINKEDFKKGGEIYAYDIGPGNCLIDSWIRNNSSKKFDKDGLIAREGNIDLLVTNYALDNFSFENTYEKSLDVKDFDIFFAKGLSLKDGAATITNFTAKLIAEGINFINKNNSNIEGSLLICGGGRKNKYLLEMIKKNLNNKNLNIIDRYEINGDFVESQAFAYLSIRSLKGLPITFPTTTRVNKKLSGGTIIKNF